MPISFLNIEYISSRNNYQQIVTSECYCTDPGMLTEHWNALVLSFKDEISKWPVGKAFWAT